MVFGFGVTHFFTMPLYPVAAQARSDPARFPLPQRLMFNLARWLNRDAFSQDALTPIALPEAAATAPTMSCMKLNITGWFDTQYDQHATAHTYAIISGKDFDELNQTLWHEARLRNLEPKMATSRQAIGCSVRISHPNRPLRVGLMRVWITWRETKKTLHMDLVVTELDEMTCGLYQRDTGAFIFD